MRRDFHMIIFDLALLSVAGGQGSAGSARAEERRKQQTTKAGLEARRASSKPVRLSVR